MDALTKIELILNLARAKNYSRLITELEELKSEIQELSNRQTGQGPAVLPPDWRLNLNRYRSDSRNLDYCSACYHKTGKPVPLMIFNEDYFECPVCNASIRKDPHQGTSHMEIPPEELE